VRDQHFAFQLATRQLREVVVALRTSHHICVVSVPTTVVLNVRDIYLPNIKICFSIETRIDHDHTSNPKFQHQRSNNQFWTTTFPAVCVGLLLISSAITSTTISGRIHTDGTSIEFTRAGLFSTCSASPLLRISRHSSSDRPVPILVTVTNSSFSLSYTPARSPP